jgi:hypothetical protein
MRFYITIANINKYNSFAAPGAPLPFSELQSQLAALQGTTSSGQTQTTPQTNSGTSSLPSGGAPPKYLECVSKAGTDIAQVQKCASLVNGG